MSGLAMASTSHGTWVVPCRRALWIPAGVRHELRMEGVVEMQSLYFDTNVFTDMPDRCRVVAISSLMRSLMAEAVALPIRYDRDGRSGAIMKLIGYEISRLRELPLSLPFANRQGSRTPVPQVLSISQSQCKNRRLGPVTASNASYLYAPVSPGNRAQLCGMETTSVPSCSASKTDCRGIRITDCRRSWIRESGSFQHIVQTIP
jgi:hypothetical protein